MRCTISILLINPWITDFAAYNLWAEPLGLLYVAAILRDAGARLNYIDCLKSRKKDNPKPRQNGCSKYIRRIIEAPSPLKGIRRHFSVYGMEEEEFINTLQSVDIPDAVLITSHMTYWYPGVFRTIELVRRVLGTRIPIVLGGIYAQLCRSHARQYSGADVVFTDRNLRALLWHLEQRTGKTFSLYPTLQCFSDFPLPLHEFQGRANFFSVLTRRGCPFSCSYCACPLLSPGFFARSSDSVLEEIKTYSRALGTPNIALYDDALLVSSEQHIIPILEEIGEALPDLALHLPNGVHAGLLTEKVAQLFFQAGVETIRIGLETSSEELQLKTGAKTTNREYSEAIQRLRETGYRRQQVGTYIMAGLPGQSPESVDRSIDFVYSSGGSPHLSYFSPIPGTGIWKEAVQSSPFPIEGEPLFQNNTVFILGNRNFSEECRTYLKQKAAELRKTP
jgi:radical SAM superfamily enzyme YgiQ (UPF0313 family)